MPGRRTTELTTTASLSNDDLLYVVDVSATTGEKSKGITKSDLAALIGTSAASSSPIENEYADITALLADQGNQTTSFLQYVIDASDDPNIASGDAYYEKKTTSTATLADDYRLLSDTETTVVVNSNNYRTLKIQDVSATSVTSVSGGKVSFEYTGANATAIIFNKLMTDALIDFYATDVDIVFYNKGSKKYETESIASGAWTTVNTDYYRGAFTGTKIQTADLTSADDLDFFIMPSTAGGAGLPAPYLFKVAPISLVPSTTAVVNIYSDYITSDTTVAIEGQTVNSVTYKFDNNNVPYLQVSVTTGATEGDFDVTINNGTESVFTDAFIVNTGTVYVPTSTDWSNVNANINVLDDGEVKLINYNSEGLADWNIPVDYLNDFQFDFVFNKSPLGNSLSAAGDDWIHFKNISDNVSQLQVKPYIENFRVRTGLNLLTPTDGALNYRAVYAPATYDDIYDALPTRVISVRWISGVLYIYVNASLIYTFTHVFTENLYIQARIKISQFIDIKYIELP